MRLTERVWPELAAADRSVVCIPVGSCEQHGPHLPMHTDTLVAEALAAALADRVERVLVGPSLTITASGEHAAFPGTLSIGTAAMTDVLVELVRSADWSDGVVLVNGHGGNRDAVDTATATSTAEGRRVLAWWPHLADGDAHAGRTETSLVLALRPDLVHLPHAVPGATRPVVELATELRAGGVAAVSPNGVLGDPTGASATEGRAILEQLVDQLVGAVAAWREQAPARPAAT